MILQILKINQGHFWQFSFPQIPETDCWMIGRPASAVSTSFTGELTSIFLAPCRYYTVFDAGVSPRVGFAPALHKANHGWKPVGFLRGLKFPPLLGMWFWTVIYIYIYTYTIIIQSYTCVMDVLYYAIFFSLLIIVLCHTILSYVILFTLYIIFYIIWFYITWNTLIWSHIESHLIYSIISITLHNVISWYYTF